VNQKMASFSYDNSDIVPETPPDQINATKWRRNRFLESSDDEEGTALSQALNGTTDDRKIIVSGGDSDQSLEESILVKSKTSRRKAKVLETDDESEDEAFESAKNSLIGGKDSEDQDESDHDESDHDESEQEESDREWSPDENDQDYAAPNGHRDPVEISSSEDEEPKENFVGLVSSSDEEEGASAFVQASALEKDSNRSINEMRTELEKLKKLTNQHELLLKENGNQMLDGGKSKREQIAKMNEKQSELLAQILHAEEVNKASTNSPKTKPDNKFKFHEPKRDTVKIPEEKNDSSDGDEIPDLSQSARSEDELFKNFLL
jgi:hypothetical protein